MTDSFQVAAIIASVLGFVKKQTACIFVVFLYRNVLETAPHKGCRDRKTRQKKFGKSQKPFLKSMRHREKGKRISGVRHHFWWCLAPVLFCFLKDDVEEK